MNYKLLLALLTASLLWGQPITGEAQKLEFKKDRIVYRGSVKLTRGETVLTAETVTVLLNEEGKPLKLIAQGRVVYLEPNRKATADYAEYDLQKEVIVLRGNAKVEEKKNILEAEEIVYDRKNETLQARGGAGKVRTIYIEEAQE